jgi:HAD superfamily hydrolase (TIGR01509 family)
MRTTTAGPYASSASAEFAAIIFDLDVVTDSADLSAAAWHRLFEMTLPQIAHGGDVAPFRFEDYYAHIDGRSSEDGVRAFLASRNLQLPEGQATDAPGALTVRGLAARTDQLVAEYVVAHGVTAYPSTAALLRRLKSSGIAAGLVAEYPDGRAIVDRAGLTDQFAAIIDGTDASAMHLSGKPAPDLLAEAAHRLHVSPQQTVVIDDSEEGIRAAVTGGFGRVVGIDRGHNRAQLRAAGAGMVVADLAGIDVTDAVVDVAPWYGQAQVDNGPWLLTFTGYDPNAEGVRETLCTLGNGYFGTRGAAPHARADGTHYPGTYIAGLYNRLESQVAETTVSDESIVNIPNWLPLTLHHADGAPIDADHGTLDAYIQQLDLRRAVLTRTFVHCDPAGRTTRITERRLVSCGACHMAALETTVEALNWSGALRVTSLLDGDVANTGVLEYRQLASRHLQPDATAEIEPRTVLLEMVTSQSRIHIAMAARTTAHSDGAQLDAPTSLVSDGRLTVGHELNLQMAGGQPVTIEKVVAITTSRDRAISSPAEAARAHLLQAGDFASLVAAHEQTWAALWDDFAIPAVAGAQTTLALHLDTFHVLQTVVEANADVDAGLPARGLHGEGYLGHVFWDEMFIYPMLTLRRPEMTRHLLSYRYRRLPAARAAAAAMGLPGAMFPWQSASDGTDVTPPLTCNIRTGHWLADTSHRQRHVGLAIAYSVIQYHQATGDTPFLTGMGGELLVEICRFFAAMSVHGPADDRFHIDATMGPDEFHDGYPGHPAGGVRDNAYTNILTAWLLHRTVNLLESVDRHDAGRLRRRMQLTAAEVRRWDLLSRRLAVPWHADGVISQFEGYERLPELDWDAYRARYQDIGRLDLILNAEGDSTNNYRVGKQADVLMLFYLLSAEELREVLERLGYSLSPETIRATTDFYTARTSHGSTLSRIVHAWVNARAERHQAWSLFTEALQVDLADTEGGTTREGVHLGAMAGTVDLIVRCFAGIETRDATLWLHPVLPPELANIEFTIIYRGQQITVQLTPHLVRLRLGRFGTHPIAVCVEGHRRLLHPGDVYETRLRVRDRSAAASAG